MNNKKEKPKKPPFAKGDQVYFTAYMKNNPSAFYICRGTIERCPEQGIRKYFKVKITAVGDRPVGGQPVVHQASLLGVTLSKSQKELMKHIVPFMKPPDWIVKDQ